MALNMDELSLRRLQVKPYLLVKEPVQNSLYC